MDQELTRYSHTHLNTFSFILCPYWLSVGDTRSAMNFLNNLPKYLKTGFPTMLPEAREAGLVLAEC